MVGFLGKADEPQVEFSVRELGGLLGRGKIEEVDRDLGMSLAKTGDQRRSLRMKEPPHVAHSKLSPLRGTLIFGNLHRIGGSLEQLAGLYQERLPRPRQFHSFGGPMKQEHPHFLLKLAQLAAQSRLRHPELRGSLGEAPLFGYTHKIAQVTQFHARIIPGRHQGANKEVLPAFPHPCHKGRMNWNHRFAQRTQRTHRTAVREILKLANQPGIISFAGGMPAPELFPVEAIRTVTDRVLRDHGPKVLQYAETEGIPELRDWIAENASRTGARVKRENVLILNGAQQAIDLVGRVFLDPGDLVLLENPTYLAALSAWRPLDARFHELACDDAGLRTEFLPEVLPTDAKAVYTIPTFQNPQGTTMTMDRRLALIDWCGRRSLPLIEDTPYDSLRYEGKVLPSLLELELESEPQPSWEEGGCVVQLGTFSKSIAPGLRVGWAIAPQPVIENLVRAKQASDLHTSPFTQRIVLELLRNGIIEQQLPKLREVYRARRDAMLESLARSMPQSVSWTRPEGGMFLMLTVPAQLDTAELLPEALNEGVAFVPGVEFYPDGSVHHTMRLNFTRHNEAEIREGIRRLARVIRRSLSDTTGQVESTLCSQGR